MALVPFWICLSSPGRMSQTLRILRFLKNTSPSEPSENISSLHPTSKGSPDVGNLSGPTIPFGALARWTVQLSPTKVHMCYLCFCSTLASMLLNKFIFYKRSKLTLINLYYCKKYVLVIINFSYAFLAIQKIFESIR